MKKSLLMGGAILLCLWGATIQSAPGDWDLRFGTGGQLPLAYGLWTEVARMPDGRLLMYDSRPSGGGRVQLRMRMLDAHGRLDANWGTGGEAAFAVDVGPVATATSVSNIFHAAGASDGRITGMVTYQGQVSADGIERISRVIRLTTEGHWDAGFAAATPTNLITDGFRDVVSPNAPWIQSDGSTLVGILCIYCDIYPLPDTVLRLRPDGSVDRRFLLWNATVLEQLSFMQSARRLADGRILVIGDTGVARFRPDGTFDAGYGTAGALSVRSAALESMVGRALDANVASGGLSIMDGEVGSDGAVVLAIAARIHDGLGDFEIIPILMRFDASGVADPGFGDKASGVTRINRPSFPGIPEDTDWYNNVDLSMGGDGRLAILLPARRGGSSFQPGMIWRFDASGRVPVSGGMPQPQWVPMNDAYSASVLLDQDAGTVYARGPTSLYRFSPDSPDSAGVLLSPGIHVEEDSLGSTEQVMVPVMRFAGSLGRLIVDYSTAAAGTTATPGLDFEPVSGRIEWADGEVGTRFIPVRVINDKVEERSPELIAIAMTVVSGNPLVLPETTFISVGPSDIQAGFPAPAPAPTPTPSPTPAPPASTSGGGGAFDLLTLLMVLLAFWTTAVRRLRVHVGSPSSAPTRAGEGPSPTAS